MTKGATRRVDTLAEQPSVPLTPEVLDHQVDELAGRFFARPTPKVLEAHSWIKARFPTVRIGRREWLRIISISTILGLALYGGVVGLCYHIAAETMLRSRAQFADPWPAELTAKEAAAITLDDLGISQDSSQELQRAIEAARTGRDDPDHRPAVLSIATNLLLANRVGSCKDCDEQCVLAIKPVLVRMLLGWPMSEAERALDLKFLHETFGEVPALKPKDPSPTPEQTRQACVKVEARKSLSAWQPSYTMVAGRQEPWPAPMVAQLTLGAPHCGPSEPNQAARDRCQLVTRLFQTVIDDTDVKAVRSFLVDFFYGWERALVFILVFVVALALRRQRKARRRLDIEAEWVRQRLDSRELAIGLDPTEPDSKIDPRLAAFALKRAFNDAFRPTLGGDAQEPIAEMVTAVAEAVQQGDLDYLKTFVDRNLTELEGSRELMNGIITIFPVIGFSATLLSLVHALAGANQIATSNGDMRSASILNITSLLSSCFATTFLALVSMAVFAVWNLLAGGREQRVITILSERLISKFRPGRKAQTGT